MKGSFIKKIFLSFITSMFVFPFVTLSAFSFSGPTHVFVTKNAINMLDGSDKKIGEFYTSNDRTILAESCTKPDDDEIEGAYKYHFFNPATEKNFMGEDLSALVKFTSHYNNAVELFSCGKRVDSMVELARALHFLEDLNTPVHTNNQDVLDTAFNFPFHISFEDKCVEIQDETKSLLSPLSTESLKYYIDNKNSAIGKACAYTANDNLYSLVKDLLPKDTVCKNAIVNAVEASEGVLYKFYLDVN